MPHAIVKGKIVRIPYNHKLLNPKRKTRKTSDSAPSLLLEEDKKYQPVLLKGEKIISYRRTRVAKKPSKKTYEIDETPYGKISVINDDFTWRLIRGAHHSGRLFLTNKRLVHVIKQGSVMGIYPRYTVDFDRPLSALQGATAEVDIKRRLTGHGKRLAVQYYKGDVDMFGDTILAQRGGTPIDEQNEISKERELRKKRERLELKQEKSKLGEQNKLKQAEQKQIEHELEELKLKVIKIEERRPARKLFRRQLAPRPFALEKRKLKERALLAAAGRRGTFLEREPIKRRFHVFGDVYKFAKEIKNAAGIE